MIKTRVVSAVCGFVLVIAGVAIAQPKRDVSPRLHPNIARAQRLCQQAWDATAAAQTANEFDLGGHAQKAKEFLDQANRELKLAAEVSNEKGR